MEGAASWPRWRRSSGPMVTAHEVLRTRPTEARSAVAAARQMMVPASRPVHAAGTWREARKGPSRGQPRLDAGCGRHGAASYDVDGAAGSDAPPARPRDHVVGDALPSPEIDGEVLNCADVGRRRPAADLTASACRRRRRGRRRHPRCAPDPTSPGTLAAVEEDDVRLPSSVTRAGTERTVQRLAGRRSG